MIPDNSQQRNPLSALRLFWKTRSGSLCRWLLMPAVCFLELMFHLWVGGPTTPAVLAQLLGFALCVGGLLSLVASLLPRKGAKVFAAVLAFLCALIMLVEYMVGNAYGSYMRPSRIVTGAGGVLTDYTDVVIQMILDNLGRIALALVPMVLVLLSGKREKPGRRIPLILAAAIGTLGGIALGFAGLAEMPGGVTGWLSSYDFNACIRERGIVTAMYTELSGLGNKADAIVLELPVIEPLPEPTEAASGEALPSAEPEKVYAPHVIPGLDFGALAQKETNPQLKSLYQYLAALKPTTENDYTGLFAGKNLIFITAEAFNYAVIDPELTPTLYRLSTKGIQFTNYYEPSWSGCTSGGELVNLSGLAMNCEMITYSHQKPFNTIGRQLMNQGYFSRAYHNNYHTFYDRHITHEDLGYEKFIGYGNGMEEGVQELWPESDLEMIDFTVPQYIDNQPFSIYYMTVSGHCRYSKLGNAMSKKNWSLVEDLPYSEWVKAYIACNLELEHALTSLVSQLEEAGIADDTVIVMAPDHYPYGLGTSWGNPSDGLAELYGVEKYDLFQRDKNTLILWSGCLEDKNIRIDAPVCSIDILPTLSNLFGIVHDSRLTVGRDVLGTEEAIALWPDHSWVTEKGQFDASTGRFTPYDGAEVSDEYVQRISAIVNNKINFSRAVQQIDFFTALQKEMGLE